MKTTLKDLHEHMTLQENAFAANVIKSHMEGLFYELAYNLEWDLDSALNVDDDFHDNWCSDEVYVSIDYDMTIVPDNKMDICVRIKFNVDATQHMETDGSRFFENISFNVFSIVFDYAGDEWDMTKDAHAKKFVNKVLDTWI